ILLLVGRADRLRDAGAIGLLDALANGVQWRHRPPVSHKARQHHAYEAEREIVVEGQPGKTTDAERDTGANDGPGLKGLHCLEARVFVGAEHRLDSFRIEALIACGVEIADVDRRRRLRRWRRLRRCCVAHAGPPSAKSMAASACASAVSTAG